MKPVLARLTFCALAMSALAIPPARAADTKISNGSVCQPYSTTTLPSELAFRANGLKNISANAEYVVCNVPVDTDSVPHWTISPDGKGGTLNLSATVSVLFHGTGFGTARCELYLGSNLAGSPATYMGELALEPDLVWSIDFNLVVADGGQWSIDQRPPVSLFCRIPPGASILRTRVRENPATDL